MNKTVLKVLTIALAVVFAVFFTACPEDSGNNNDNNGWNNNGGGTWTPDGYTPIQLTENQWADGNISTSGRQQWFTFTATASTQYIHVTFDTLTDLYVQLYDSTGNTVGSSANLYSSTRYASRTLTSGQKYYIKVTPYSSSYSGTYRIGFNASSPIGTSGDFEYETAITTITITGYTGNGGAVNIPSTINGKSVVSIGDEAFYCNQLTSVNIPNSVTTIGSSAFYGNQLTSVTIPNSVTTIGNGAFANNQLLLLIIVYGTTTIGNGAFANNQLTSVNIPNSVISIGKKDDDYYGPGAFSDNQLTSVTIPNSVTSIGRGAFSWNQLTSITIPNSVTTIGDGAFSSNQLTSVTIGANVSLGYTLSGVYRSSFPGDFDTVYNNGGKAAGRFTCPTAGINSVWSKVN